MTSSCSTVIDLLADYLEGHLAPATEAELERHLAACPACVAQVRSYRSTVRLLRSLGDADLPPELRTSLRAFLHRQSDN